MWSSVAAITAFFAVSLWGFVSGSQIKGAPRFLAIGLGILGALLHFMVLLVAPAAGTVVAVELAICFLAGRLAASMPSRSLGYLVVAILVGVATNVHWYFGRDIPLRYRSGQITACNSNLKNLGTAQEMYSTDWSGKYSTDLARLTPNYLRTLPECPAAGTVTYRLSTGPSARYNTNGYEEYYLFECAGENHKAVGVPTDHPRFDGVNGLVDGIDHRYEWYRS